MPPQKKSTPMDAETPPNSMAPETGEYHSDQPTYPPLEGTSPHHAPVNSPDIQMQQEFTNSMNNEDTNFPPLPSGPTHREVGTSKPRLGKIKLTLGRRKPRVSDTSKRLQPSSPLIDRSSKRHTSTAIPPLGTPILPTFHLTQEDTLSPPSNAQAQQPTFTFGIDQGLSRNRTQATNLSETCDIRHNGRGESKVHDQSTTVVGNSAWDDILVDSPRGSPTHLNQPLGTSPGFNAASPWRTMPDPSQNPKQGRVRVNSLGLSSVHTYRREPREEIFRDVKTDNFIMTNTTGLQRTAKPNGGWPKIHLGIHPFENVTGSQIASWKRVATPKVWARLFRSKYETNSLATVDKTRALLKNLVRVESDVTLGVSFPLQDHAMESERFPPPYHMMISSLSDMQIDHLISLEVVSTKDITLIFKLFSDTRPTFVMTIYGLIFVDSEEARSAVTSLIVNGIQESEQVIKHIVECAPDHPDRVVSDILNNISVKFLEVKRNRVNGGDFRGWNIFLHHSFLTDDDHIKLIQLMRTCTFPSATAGFGLPLLEKDTLLCTNCKSIDHDTPNCPFPDLPGWFGYKPTKSPQSQIIQSAYNNDADHSTENYHRGRGLGRGRGGGTFRGNRPYGRRAFRGQWN